MQADTNVITAMEQARTLVRSHERFIPCLPPRSTHQSGSTILKGKDGRYFVGKNKKGKQVANELYIIAMQGRPSEPFTGALSLTIAFCFPYRKAETKLNKGKQHLPHTSRPDCDNLAKALIDAMQKANWFKDDAIVNELRVTKCYSQRQGLFLYLREFQYQ